MPAAVSLLYFYIVTDAKRRTLSLFACLTTPLVNMFLEVFKSTLLSPSKDTRRCATHVSEPCHTARIQPSCSPCMNVQVLEERAEVRHTDAQRDGQKDELDVKKDAWLLAPAIRVQESAQNPSGHGLNDIARVLLQMHKRKKTSTKKPNGRRHPPASEIR